ncbi:MAG: bifunctional methylenetetrahydrofolate dehydrogenase/methenyltetrahydrofolate cyclohydrolase FolD [Oscillospiraceae bacterium]|nr:bifunctional methylenetetrahydrofolate dehydrogenase/methenyltetrahydrofolate cyclohydrolase FolD [Oscillospiraceae bacterium]
MAVIIDGKAVSQRIREEIRQEADALTAKGIHPGLAVIIVGDDPASRIYVNNKKKACAQCGIHSEEFSLSADTTENELLELIHTLNARQDINGILCQLPLPRGFNEDVIINAIDPKKDVDAFHPGNVGGIMLNKYSFLPCTPAGVMELLKAVNTQIAGKRAVVVGRSNIVGKPMALLLLHADATVTICHSKTAGLTQICREADILVAAVGRANFITSDMIKPGAVVIDVGMNRDENGKLCGDVDFAAAEKVASALTPVPGGVGPMTITMLLKNTVTAAKNQIENAGARVARPVGI